MPMLQSLIDAEAGAATNGGRRPTVVGAPTPVSPELSDRPRRRTFTARDKIRILAETDRAAETGGIGAILRREGVYSSSLTEWRKQRDAGAFGALAPAKRGPKSAEPNPLAAKLALAQRDNARLTLRLKRAEAIIELQKKSCGAAGHPAGAERRRALTEAVVALAPDSRMTAAACAALGVSRAGVQRRRARLTAAPAMRRLRPRPARALTAPQQQIVLDLLHAPRFADQAPAEIYATLLDEGAYHCSIRTMYRVLSVTVRSAAPCGTGALYDLKAILKVGVKVDAGRNSRDHHRQGTPAALEHRRETAYRR